MSRVRIFFETASPLARKSMSASADDRADFCDPAELSFEGVFAPGAATLESDYWKLDGSFRVFPDRPEDTCWGYWSKSMSDEKGSFLSPPLLTVNFDSPQTTDGISFEFSPFGNNFPSAIEFSCYLGGSEVFTEEIAPDNWRFSYERESFSFDKATFRFLSTNFPERYIKLQSLSLGRLIFFSDEELSSAFLLEELDPTGSELSVNTLEFTVYSETDDFNIFEPKGVYSLLSRRGRVCAEAEISEGNIFGLGSFYISERETKENRLFSIYAEDAAAVLGESFFAGGMYFEKPARELIGELMADAGFGCALESIPEEKTLSGYLPRCTHREALQQICFALGAVADSARSGTVNIRLLPSLSEVKSHIGRDRRFTGASFRLKKLVTGVRVTSHNYSKKDTAEEIFREELPAGISEINFSEPVADIEAQGALILDSGANFCRVNVTSPGEVLIRGKKFNDNTKIFYSGLQSIPAGESENLVSVSEATLISDKNAQEAADRLFALNCLRIEQEISFVLNGEAPGEAVQVEVMPGKYRPALIRRLETDLAGGFVAKAVMTGE